MRDARAIRPASRDARASAFEQDYVSEATTHTPSPIRCITRGDQYRTRPGRRRRLEVDVRDCCLPYCRDRPKTRLTVRGLAECFYLSPSQLSNSSRCKSSRRDPTPTPSQRLPSQAIAGSGLQDAKLYTSRPQHVTDVFAPRLRDSRALFGIRPPSAPLRAVSRRTRTCRPLDVAFLTKWS